VHPGVSNSEALTSIFGKWPSFHDAEVLRIRLDRGEGLSGASLEADIHAWEMTPEVDARGFFVLRHHTLVTLRFDDIAELDLHGFNHQNVLWDLKLERLSELESAREQWSVALPTSHGVSARFVCARISVIAARPHEPD
jgi:Immunity protein 50